MCLAIPMLPHTQPHRQSSSTFLNTRYMVRSKSCQGLGLPPAFLITHILKTTAWQGRPRNILVSWAPRVESRFRVVVGSAHPTMPFFLGRLCQQLTVLSPDRKEEGAPSCVLVT